jgi:hypothetical protein
MSDQEFVLSVCSEAKCPEQPVKFYWPGAGAYERYAVWGWWYMSRSLGQGLTKEEAWKNAAAYLERKGHTR